MQIFPLCTFAEGCKFYEAFSSLHVKRKVSADPIMFDDMEVDSIEGTVPHARLIY